MKKIVQLLGQMSNQEILKMPVPKGTQNPTRSPNAMLEQTGQIIIIQAVHSQNNLPEIYAELGGIYV